MTACQDRAQGHFYVTQQTGAYLTTAVIIPALDEEATIGGVLADIPPGLVDHVIVVDNGSADGTGRVAREGGAEVVREDRRGYGWACYAGYRAARGADILVFMDGDGADDPAQIADLVRPIRAGEADLVLGSRERGEKEPGALLPHARFGNWLASRLMRALYGLRVTDLGPFRAVRRETLDALDMREMTYGWPTEMMVKAAKRGCRIVEIPVDYRSRTGGRSKISGTIRGTVLAAYFIIGTTLKHAWTK
jgi:glycosyltransferase involved in cell wall biosynthesis